MKMTDMLTGASNLRKKPVQKTGEHYTLLPKTQIWAGENWNFAIGSKLQEIKNFNPKILCYQRVTILGEKLSSCRINFFSLDLKMRPARMQGISIRG